MWTTDNLTALNEAIAQGARRVKYGDKEVEYMTLNEMLKAKSVIEKALGIGKVKTRKFASFTKGLQ